MRLVRRPLAAVLLLGALGLASVSLTAWPAAAAVTVTVTPDQGLNDRQAVHVHATGLPPNHSPIQVVQCVRGAVDSLHCDGDTLDVSADTDGQGTYDNPHFVIRTLSQKNHDSIDCDKDHPCEIYVGVDYNNTFKVNSAAAPIAFVGAAPVSPAASKSSGNSGLVVAIVAGVIVVVGGAVIIVRRRSARVTA